MESIHWKDRAMGSTRGRIIALLRRGERTVNELADGVALTDNAVRTHLAALERDGLVAFAGVRRGVGKPAHLYTLTRNAETLFPRAYSAVLRTLLDVVRGSQTSEEVDRLVAEVGRRLAEPFPRAAGDASARADAAVSVLSELGGVAEAHVDGAVATIRGFGCPLREAVDGHPDVCRIAAALLSDVVGRDVTECCDRDDDAPSCRFTFAA